MSELIQWPMARYWHRAWNPLLGCQPVSPACENCWAKDWADRFKQPFKPHEGSAKNPPRKGVVFCGNMTDLFGDWVNARDSIGHIRKTLECREATFLYLTKRPVNMVYDLQKGWLFREFGEPDEKRSRELFSNHYFGVTAENEDCWKRRWVAMKRIPEWANWWISVEPMLGPISLGLLYMKHPPKFVVVGCESGPNRRPCRMEWVESIVAQCIGVGVPVFVKQLDILGKCVTDINQFPSHLRIRQVPWAKEWT